MPPGDYTQRPRIYVRMELELLSAGTVAKFIFREDRQRVKIIVKKRNGIPEVYKYD